MEEKWILQQREERRARSRVRGAGAGVSRREGERRGVEGAGREGRKRARKGGTGAHTGRLVWGGTFISRTARKADG